MILKTPKRMKNKVFFFRPVNVLCDLWLLNDKQVLFRFCNMPYKSPIIKVDIDEGVQSLKGWCHKSCYNDIYKNMDILLHLYLYFLQFLMLQKMIKILINNNEKYIYICTSIIFCVAFSFVFLTEMEKSDGQM